VTRLTVVAATLLLLVPLLGQAAYAQVDQNVPDLAQVALSPADVDGWTPGASMRDEVWNVDQSAAAPNAPSAVAVYQTRFALDSGQQLTTQAMLMRADLAVTYFSTLTHNGLGQTPIQGVAPLGHDALGWRELDNLSAVARSGDVILQLHVSGLTDAAVVSDDQVTAWLSRLIQRLDAAPRGPAFDWTQLMAGQPNVWSLVLDAGLAGDDWQQQTGLELTSTYQAGQVASVSATREFDRTGAVSRTLRSSASVFPSPDAASASGMAGDGTSIDAPALGDEASAFRAARPGGREAPTVTYTINVRHGSVVLTTEETGVAYSLDSPDEAFALATAADAHATQFLIQ
jgi:hypothetical protein